MVYGMSEGGFLVNYMWVRGSILLFPSRVYLWGVQEHKSIKPHTLDLIKVIKPKPCKY